uniref:Uncharacterized protein n=1 Tax=Octopus bimaculoides TaxID=37653 RepID=A0A0L8I8V0_OCTBM
MRPATTKFKHTRDTGGKDRGGSLRKLTNITKPPCLLCHSIPIWPVPPVILNSVAAGLMLLFSL